MPPTRPPYPAELKRQIVELARAGRSPAELAREFEPTAQTIQNWIRQADRDEGLREDGLTSSETEELRRLRRENKQLRIEREILSKAAAWFAAETDAIQEIFAFVKAHQALWPIATQCRVLGVPSVGIMPGEHVPPLNEQRLMQTSRRRLKPFIPDQIAPMVPLASGKT